MSYAPCALSKSFSIAHGAWVLLHHAHWASVSSLCRSSNFIHLTIQKITFLPNFLLDFFKCHMHHAHWASVSSLRMVLGFCCTMRIEQAFSGCAWFAYVHLLHWFFSLSRLMLNYLFNYLYKHETYQKTQGSSWLQWKTTWVYWLSRIVSLACN